MGAPTYLPISKAELSKIVRLIGLLQGRLETEIHSFLVPGTDSPMPEDADVVARARREWRAAEQVVKRLEALRAAPTHPTKSPSADEATWPGREIRMDVNG